MCKARSTPMECCRLLRSSEPRIHPTCGHRMCRSVWQLQLRQLGTDQNREKSALCEEVEPVNGIGLTLAVGSTSQFLHPCQRISYSVEMHRPRDGTEWHFRFYDSQDLLRMERISGDGSRVIARKARVPSTLTQHFQANLKPLLQIAVGDLFAQPAQPPLRRQSVPSGEPGISGAICCRNSASNLVPHERTHPKHLPCPDGPAERVLFTEPFPFLCAVVRTCVRWTQKRDKDCGGPGRHLELCFPFKRRAIQVLQSKKILSSMSPWRGRSGDPLRTGPTGRHHRRWHS